MKQNIVSNQQMAYLQYEETLEEMYFLELRLLEEEYRIKQLCIHQEMDT